MVDAVQRRPSAGVPVIIVSAIVALGITYMMVGAPEAACDAYEIGLSITGEDRIFHDGLVIVDHRHRARDGCHGDDLWHYDQTKLDGVLFDDCRISWVGGGRTSAEDVGIHCST